MRDVDPAKLTIMFWDGGQWLNAGTARVDSANGLVSVTVNHFTMYDIAEDNSTAPSKLVAYWTENPVRARDGGYFVYRVPHTGEVTFVILDLAGDVVCRLLTDTRVSPGQYSIAWHGDNVAGRFAGAGMYVYMFMYRDAVTGEKEMIRKPIGLLR